MSIFHIEETITLNSPDDISYRPYFESPIKPQPYRYVHIAAVYCFKDQSIRCGVSDCLQAHRHGFLVMISDQKETNLCEACGQRFFDVSIEKHKKTLQQQARVREQKIRLNTVLEQVDVIKDRIKELKQAAKGANWLYRVLTSFRKTYPTDLLTALKGLAANKENSAVLAAVAENEADPSQLEHVEQLQGLGIFAADIREELIGKILIPLKELEELAGDPAANPPLTRYCKWADSLEEQFSYAQYLVEEGRAFFDKKNLERLKKRINELTNDRHLYYSGNGGNYDRRNVFVPGFFSFRNSIRRDRNIGFAPHWNCRKNCHSNP